MKVGCSKSFESSRRGSEKFGLGLLFSLFFLVFLLFAGLARSFDCYLVCFLPGKTKVETKGGRLCG